MNNVVSDRIKKAIEKSGYSFVELEKRTGVSKSALQRYSQGVTTKVPVDVVNAIGGATGISPFYLIGWGDDPNYFPLKDIEDYVEERPNKQDIRLKTICNKLSSHNLLNELFDKVCDLTDNDIESVIMFVDTIRKQRGIDE